MKSASQLLLLAGLLGYGYYSSRQSNQALAECSNRTAGTVVKINRRVGKIPTDMYRYQVNNETYETTSTVPKSISKNVLKPGYRINVLVACGNPEISKLVGY